MWVLFELISFSNFKLFPLNSCVEGGNNSLGQSAKFWLPEEGVFWGRLFLDPSYPEGMSPEPKNPEGKKHNHSITPRTSWCLFWLKQLWETQIWGNLVRRIWQPLLSAKIDVIQGKTRRKCDFVGEKNPYVLVANQRKVPVFLLKMVFC